MIAERYVTWLIIRDGEIVDEFDTKSEAEENVGPDDRVCPKVPLDPPMWL